MYLRNIFPEYCFKDRSLTGQILNNYLKGGVDSNLLIGINIKALTPETEDSKLLITWLEKGKEVSP